MRNKIIFFLLGLVFLFYVSPFLRKGIFLTHDGENHMARIGSFSQSIQDGQFPVRWAGNLNFSYGSPVFIFFYPIPYYASLIPQLIGFDIVNSFKILLLFSFITSFFTFYIFIAHFVKKEVAIVGSLAYLLAPYHLLNLYVRGDVGELFGYSLLPLVFACIEKFKQKKDIYYVLLGGVFYGLLIMAHNGISLLFTPVIFLYILLSLRKYTEMVSGLVIILFGFMLSSFFWIPALLESKYTNARLYIGNFFQSNFSSLGKIIHSDWGFDPSINTSGGLAPQIGIVYFSLFIFCVIVLSRHKKIKQIYLWILLFLLGIFLTQKESSFLWQNINILKLFQFPWRIVVVSVFSTIIVISLGLNALKDKRLIFLSGLLIIASTVLFVRTREYTYFPDKYYKSFLGTTYYHGEATSIWSAGDAFEKPQTNVSIIEGSGSIKELERKSNVHIYNVTVDSRLNFLDRTFYFPGWKAYVDNSEVPIQFQDPQYRGLITFPIDIGEHIVEIKFEETKTRLFSDILSILSCIMGILLLVCRKKINHVYE